MSRRFAVTRALFFVLAMFVLTMMLPSAAWADTVHLTGDTQVGPPSDSTNNYGTLTTINVGGATPFTGLIQFDLTTLPAGTTSAQISKATLYLFVHSVGAPGSININAATGVWQELTVVGSTAPSVGATVVSGLS